jgi:riboflavin synthase alpha subunit
VNLEVDVIAKYVERLRRHNVTSASGFADTHEETPK